MRTTTNRAATAAGALVLTAALAACGSADGATPDDGSEGAGASDPAGETITVEHAQGTTEVPADPERVVVFDMGTLDTLDTLGVEVAGVPRTSVPSFLEEYAGEEYADVGTLFEPDYEALARLEPDLVIVGGRSAAAYPDLAQTYPTVDASFEASPDFLAGFSESATTIGEIFGKETEVEEALTGIEEQMAEIRPLGEAAGTGMVLQTSGGEISLNGAASRFGLIFTELGVTEAAEVEDDSGHGQVVSFEMIRDTNPDWLFVNDRDAAIGESGEAAEQILDNELVAATTAWQEDQVLYLDGERWYIVMHGLSNVPAMLEQVGQALAQQ